MRGEGSGWCTLDARTGLSGMVAPKLKQKLKLKN